MVSFTFQVIIFIILCGKVCRLLATGRWYSLGFPVSSTNKTDHHNITEILLKVALNPINQIITFLLYSVNYFRLVAEKINKNERKNKAEIHMEYQAREERAFWRALGSDPDDFIGVGQILECSRSYPMNSNRY